MVLSIAEASNRERAAIGVFRLLPANLRKELTAATRTEVVPMAIRAAQAKADTPTMRTIAGRARLSVWRGVPGVAFGGTRPVTSTGVPGRVLVRGLEYGGRGNWRQTVATTSRKGKRYTVRRRTTRQFMPDRSGSPTAIYPAMESIADDVLGMWTDLVEGAAVRAFNGER